ncbi:MAG: phosphopantetheine-binding protein [Balneolaceae bacterium]
MNQEHLLRIQEVVSETLLVEDITSQDDLFELGYLDSLSIVSLMVAIEEEFSISLSLETVDLEEFRSVESICTLISPLIEIPA